MPRSFCEQDKRPQAKCPQMFEMSICGEYVYNIYVEKKPSKKMANSSAPSLPFIPSPDQMQHRPWLTTWYASKHI